MSPDTPRLAALLRQLADELERGSAEEPSRGMAPPCDRRADDLAKQRAKQALEKRGLL